MNPTTNPTTPPEPQAGATPDLAAIQARCEGAYPSVQLNKEFPWIVNDPEGREIASFEWNTDAEFYVHARADMRALLAALATSRTETAHYKAATDEWLKKTEWVQAQHAELGAFLGQHRADVMTLAIDSLRAQLATLTATLAQREAEVAELRAEVPLISGKIHNEARTCLGKTHRHKSSDGSEWACLPIGQVVTPMESLIADNVRIAAARDTALARVRELEAAMDELKRRLNALETDVYKYQNQCDPEEAIPAYITGEIERISKSASDAAARADGTGEEGGDGVNEPFFIWHGHRYVAIRANNLIIIGCPICGDGIPCHGLPRDEMFLPHSVAIADSGAMTVTPSVVCPRNCGWHVTITNGEAAP